jgi:hypothetical protein
MITTAAIALTHGLLQISPRASPSIDVSQGFLFSAKALNNCFVAFF